MAFRFRLRIQIIDLRTGSESDLEYMQWNQESLGWGSDIALTYIWWNQESLEWGSDICSFKIHLAELGKLRMGFRCKFILLLALLGKQRMGFFLFRFRICLEEFGKFVLVPINLWCKEGVFMISFSFLAQVYILRFAPKKDADCICSKELCSVKHKHFR